MVRFIVPSRHIIHTLLNDPQALPHLFDSDRTTIVAIAVNSDRNIKVKIFITTIRSILSEIPLKSGGSQSCSSYTPVKRLLSRVCANPLGSSLQNAVSKYHFVILIYSRRHKIQQFSNPAFPACRKVLRYTTYPEPSRMHSRTTNRLYYVKYPLPFYKHIEYR